MNNLVLRSTDDYANSRSSVGFVSQTIEENARPISVRITSHKSINIKNQIGANLHNLQQVARVNVNKPKNNSEKTTISSSSSLEIIHLNIQSLRNRAHLTELKELVNTRKSDIVTISETWLNTTITSAEVKIEGYKLFRMDRLHKQGGGVCAYVRKELKATVLKELSYISERNFHQLWIKVQCKKSKSFLVCATYRPEDAPLNSFEDLLKPSYIQALVYNKPIVILGDLNCDYLKKSCPKFKALDNFSSEMNLYQLIKSPTRITETSATLIDVIFVSSTSLVRESGVMSRSISDHLPVYAKLKLQRPKTAPQFVRIRSYKNYTASSFAAELASKADHLLTVFNENDVDTKLNNFNCVLQTVLDGHAPMRNIKIRSRSCPFVNQDIRNLMHSRDQLHRKFLQSRSASDWNIFKDARNMVKRAIREAEKKYTTEEVLQHRNNPSSLWKIINRVIPSKEQENQTYTKDLKLVANEFNQFFSTVGVKAGDVSRRLAEDNNISLPDSPPATATVQPNEQFYLKPVSSETVRRIILSLPSNKSPGPDKVSPRIIKDCLPVVLGPLTEIINCSIVTNTFPSAWKEAEVIPILKEGDHEQASNNRPLSLLPVASKIIEKIVLEQFNAYLQHKNRLTSHQSDNKKYHSTETLNILTTDTILEAMDSKKLTALILLDLSKAFDSVEATKVTNSHRVVLKEVFESSTGA